ncbi:MAG TPA: Mur ligase family protein [Thermodesulfobacteriota bacterium]|nr:Mur ligase family protein [Thermodesulfobacteriota bacterium]
MKLSHLIAALPAKEVFGSPETDIAGLAYHSGGVQNGFLFAAIRGLRDDGRRFIPDALARGARAILVDDPFPRLEGAAVQIVVPDAREALARLSSAFYGFPSSALTVVGITGTNGKTTTSYLLEAILREAGRSPGVIGTVNYRYREKVFPAPTTTPESLDLQKILHAMRSDGVTHAVLEVSSHALDLQRVRGCDFDAAIFTNLTRDHLDYHGTMEAYFRAKELLFTRFLRESGKKERSSIINMDDPKGPELALAAFGTIIGYGVSSGEVRPKKLNEGPGGIRCRIATPGGPVEIE